LLILELQPSADSGVGDSILGLRQGGPRGLDIEAILGLLDQSLEELEVLDRDECGSIFPASMDDDPLTLVLRAVQDLGHRPAKLDHVEPHHFALLRNRICDARVVDFMFIMYMIVPGVNLGSIIEGATTQYTVPGRRAVVNPRTRTR
jgi:hypothetical protein